MAANILVVDGQVTHGIVLKVKLLAARYGVRMARSLTEAKHMIDAARPDLVILDCGAERRDVLEFIQDFRDDEPTREVPLITLGHFCGPDERLAALAAGADDVLSKPIHEVMLLARIRSLLRARDSEAELTLRGDAGPVLGLAEPTEHFEGQIYATLITPEVDEARGRALAGVLPGHVQTITPEQALGAAGPPANTDLFVIDARGLDSSDLSERIFRLVPDLRARSDTRHAAQLVIMPKGSEGLAAMILDLGSNDVVGHDVGLNELTHRARGLLRDKRQQDRQRATVRSGLKAAITDPLTGIHNRRYADAQLDRMAEAALAAGQDFALMLLDIDHFKLINDRWGHSAGDTVLKEFALRLGAEVRTGDLLARIGGEEFLVAMPDTSERLAKFTAERLCNLIEESPFALPSRAPLNVTVSIGVAMGGPGHPGTIADLYDRADAALYAAKLAGRNTVSLSAA